MSIRFQCTECGRRLRAADDKVGKQFRCPNCKTVVRVPMEEPATESVVPPLAHHASTQSPARPQATEFVQKTDFVSISRKALYAQGILIVAVGLIAFCLGYAVGPGRDGSARVEAAPAGPFRIDGRLTYSDGPQQRGDAGAVIVVLPQGPFPDERIPIEGLRPADSIDPDESIGVRAIESLGGIYRRTNGEGRFDLTFAQGGKYYLLLLSRNGRRADDEAILPDHLNVMAGYFQNAAGLLVDRRYSWEKIEVTGDRQFDHAFGSRPR